MIAFAAQLASAAALRSTNELVEQLQEQLRKERAQHAFDVARLNEEVKLLVA